MSTWRASSTPPLHMFIFSTFIEDRCAQLIITSPSCGCQSFHVFHRSFSRAPTTERSQLRLQQASRAPPTRQRKSKIDTNTRSRHITKRSSVEQHATVSGFVLPFSNVYPVQMLTSSIAAANFQWNGLRIPVALQILHTNRKNVQLSTVNHWRCVEYVGCS